MVVKKKGTIRIWLRNDKQNESGKIPLFLIYSVSGKRAYLSSGILIYPEGWDNLKKRVVTLTTETAKTVYGLSKKEMPTMLEVERDNERLSFLKMQIRKAEDYFTATETPFDATMILGRVKENILPQVKKEERQRAETEVVRFINDFCDHNEEQPDIMLRKKRRTIQTYRNVARDLLAFQEEGYPVATFSNIDAAYLNKFFSFLVKENGNNNITCAKKISTLKTLLTFAAQKKYGYNKTVPTDYKDFTITRTDNKNEVVALTNAEYEAIRGVELDFPPYDIARDVFIFSCNTGLRISDLEELSTVHISGDEINKIVAKTGERIQIPLSETAKRILTKYGNDPRKLMRLHRNKINIYLKEIAKLAGIDTPIEKVREKGTRTVTSVQPKYERISIHTGRKSFATIMLSEGVSPTDVMKLTGHRTWAAFKRYVDVSDTQKRDAIKKAFD